MPTPSTAHHPALVYKRMLDGTLRVMGGVPYHAAEAATALLSGGEEAAPGRVPDLILRASGAVDAFADALVLVDDANYDAKVDPTRGWSREEWEAVQEHVAWFAVYADLLHGCAVAADLRRAGL
jgi:hypothetical protein